MTRNELLWLGAIAALLLMGALSFLPFGLEPPLRPEPVAVTRSGAVDDAAWPQWLEARLQPAVEAPRTAAPVAALPGYSLVGLVEVDERMLAVIAGGGSIRSLALGDMLEGYQAVTIDADHIVLARDGDEVVLRLNR